MGRRVNHSKLHRAMAEGSKLRIYRVTHVRSRCIICATAMVDPGNRKIHLKENPTLSERMNNPERTNGTPLSIQFWLQDDQHKLFGPCGQACGGKAVYASWSKEEREKYRQQLLASGVPAEEVEDRLEQFAETQWREMLRIYKRAERDAQKLGIDITTMTYGEIVVAIKEEKERLRLEYLFQRAKDSGIVVEVAPPDKWELRGVVQAANQLTGATLVEYSEVVSTAQEVELFIRTLRTKQHEHHVQQAQQQRAANRAKYKDHADFLDWAIPSAGRNARPYYQIRELEDWLSYLETDSVASHPMLLSMIENMAVEAKSWPYEAWTKAWPTGVSSTQPQVQVVSVPAVGQLPACPKCGGKLIHKTGTSHRYGKPRAYDFYGCENWKVHGGCDGSMKTQEYNNLLGVIQGTVSAPVQQSFSPPSQNRPEPVAQIRKRNAYWGS